MHRVGRQISHASFDVIQTAVPIQKSKKPTRVKVESNPLKIRDFCCSLPSTFAGRYKQHYRYRPPFVAIEADHTLIAFSSWTRLGLHIDIPHWMGLMCNRNKTSHRHHRRCYDHRHHGQHRHVYLHLYSYSGSLLSSLSYNRYRRYRYHHYHYHRIHVSVAVFAQRQL